MKQLLWIMAGSLVLAGNVAWSASDDAGDAELERQLDDARKRLDEAAREIGELTGRLHGDAMEQVFRIVRREDGKRRAMLGINIGERNVDGEVSGVSSKGVVVLAVTPGGPAEKAGLMADDIITRLNDTPLEGGGKASNDKLMAVMEKLEPGSRIELEYLRGGKKKKATLEAGEMSAPRGFAMLAPGGERVFKWQSREGSPMPAMPPIPGLHGSMVAPMVAHHWRGMELVQLTPKLGEYFGTDKGLLVVRAPESVEGLELEEGDVILKIGDREPQDVGHAMRILRSYAAGESTDIEIMRKKRKRKLSYKAPDGPAIGAAPGFHYRFMSPEVGDAEMDIVIETDESESGDRQIVIKKRRHVTGDGDGEVVIEEEDIGT